MRRTLWVVGTVTCLALVSAFVVGSSTLPSTSLPCLKGIKPRHEKSRVVRVTATGPVPARDIRILDRIFYFNESFETFDRRAKADFAAQGRFVESNLPAKTPAKYYVTDGAKREAVIMRIETSGHGRLKVTTTEYLQPNLMDKIVTWCQDLFKGRPAPSARVTSLLPGHHKPMHDLPSRSVG